MRIYLEVINFVLVYLDSIWLLIVVMVWKFCFGFSDWLFVVWLLFAFAFVFLVTVCMCVKLVALFVLIDGWLLTCS